MQTLADEPDGARHQADEALLVERRGRIVPGPGDDVPGAGAVADQPGEVEHARLRAALEADIGKLVRAAAPTPGLIARIARAVSSPLRRSQSIARTMSAAEANHSMLSMWSGLPVKRATSMRAGVGTGIIGGEHPPPPRFVGLLPGVERRRGRRS